MQSRSSRLLPRLSLLSTRSCSSPHLRTLTARLPLHPHSRKRWSPSSVCLRCFQPTTPTFVSCHSRPQCFSTSASPSPQPSPSSPPNFPSPSQTSRSALPPPPRMPPPPSFSNADNLQERNRRLLKYAAAVAIFFLGASYAAVPLYRIFCQRTGYGGTTQRDLDYSGLGKGVSDREVEVTFMADTAPDLHWSFTPSQPKLKVKVGEPVLAFYKATNNRDKPVTGVATYNVTPMKTGFYFHKIQCFCFDEQRLRAHETVDMPVFFYIDPAINEDRRCNDVTHLTLSYTFFAMKSEEEEEEEEAAAMALMATSAEGEGNQHVAAPA